MKKYITLFVLLGFISISHALSDGWFKAFDESNFKKCYKMLNKNMTLEEKIIIRDKVNEALSLVHKSYTPIFLNTPKRDLLLFFYMQKMGLASIITILALGGFGGITTYLLKKDAIYLKQCAINEQNTAANSSLLGRANSADRMKAFNNASFVHSCGLTTEKDYTATLKTIISFNVLGAVSFSACYMIHNKYRKSFELANKFVWLSRIQQVL